MERRIVPEDLTTVHDHFVASAKKIIETDNEEAAAQLFLIKLDPNTPGKIVNLAALHPEQVNAMMQSVTHKRVFMAMIASLLENPAFQCDVVVHVTESWLRMEKGGPEDMNKFLETYQHGDIKKDPDRKEALTVTLHIAGPRSYTGVHIIETKDGKRTVNVTPLDLNWSGTGNLMLNPESPSSAKH